MNAIEEQYLKQASLVSDSLILFPSDVTTRILHAIRGSGINLLGIDGFFIVPVQDDLDTKKKVQPLMEYSIDFTASQNKSIVDRFECAINKIREWDFEIYFEIIIS